MHAAVHSTGTKCISTDKSSPLSFRVPLNYFIYYCTPSPKYFSTFPHRTCFLSVSCSSIYLAAFSRRDLSVTVDQPISRNHRFFFRNQIPINLSFPNFCMESLLWEVKPPTFQGKKAPDGFPLPQLKHTNLSVFQTYIPSLLPYNLTTHHSTALSLSHFLLHLVEDLHFIVFCVWVRLEGMVSLLASGTLLLSLLSARCICIRAALCSTAHLGLLQIESAEVYLEWPCPAGMVATFVFDPPLQI